MTTRKKDYSSKLPMSAMRLMGGHGKKRNSYSVLRNSVKPSQSLIDQVFPFVQDALKSISLDQTTAMSTLTWLQLIAKIVLQDAACMMLAGRRHCIFNHPVFKGAEFKDFLTKMEEKLDAQVVTVNNTIEEVLPGVLRRMDGLQSGQSELKTSLNKNTEKISNVETMVHEINDNSLKQDHIRQLFNHFQTFRFNSTTGTEAHTHQDISPQETTQESPPQNYPPLNLDQPRESNKPYEIDYTHSCVSTIVQEWYGLGLYAKQHTNLPEDGGLAAMERKFKASWRKHYNTREQKVLSRIKNTMIIVNEISTVTKKPLQHVCIAIDKLLQENRRNNLTNIAAYIKKNASIIKAQL